MKDVVSALTMIKEWKIKNRFLPANATITNYPKSRQFFHEMKEQEDRKSIVLT
jgi:hypothetical protein